MPSFRIIKNAQARNAYGLVAQEIVCATLGLQSIPINGNCSVCFDAEKNNVFYEIKSCKRSGKVVVYDWRLRKEKATGVELHYAILLHNVKGSDGTHLMEEFSASNLALLVVKHSTILALAAKESLCQLKRNSVDPRCGYSRKGYSEGYRNIPGVNIREKLPIMSRKVCFDLYEIPFAVDVFEEEK